MTVMMIMKIKMITSDNILLLFAIKMVKIHIYKIYDH